MGQAISVVNAARTKVGVVESGGPDGHSGNIVEFWDWWDKVTGEHDQGASWCACFVSWAFSVYGLSSLVAAKNPHGFIYCPDGVNFFKKKNQWHDAKDAVAGDVVFYDWEGKGLSDHVGIVISNHGQYLVTVEGNTSAEHASGSQQNGGGVYLRNRVINSTILGVGRPAYK